MLWVVSIETQAADRQGDLLFERSKKAAIFSRSPEPTVRSVVSLPIVGKSACCCLRVVKNAPIFASLPQSACGSFDAIMLPKERTGMICHAEFVRNAPIYSRQFCYFIPKKALVGLDPEACIGGPAMNQLPLLQQQRTTRQQQMMLSKLQGGGPRFGASQGDSVQANGGTRRARFDEGCDPSKTTRSRFHEEDVRVSALQTQGALPETSVPTAISRPHLLPSERFVGGFEQMTAV